MLSLPNRLLASSLNANLTRVRVGLLNTFLVYAYLCYAILNKLIIIILKIQQYIVQINYEDRSLTSNFLFGCIEDELESAKGVTCDITGLMSKSFLIHTYSKNCKCSREYI
jgi:hypothetical protein